MFDYVQIKKSDNRINVWFYNEYEKPLAIG